MAAAGSLEDDGYESAKASAARAAKRRQNAAAYLTWESENGRDGVRGIDQTTATVSLDGADW